MNLIKEHWGKEDIHFFEEYLMSFSKGEEKANFEKRIINTALPCIAVPSFVVDKIVKDILKGNYFEFINLWLWNNFTETSILGKIISKIKNFDDLEKYLTIYALKVDNWASCDCLRFKIKKDEKDKYFRLAVKFVENEKPFVKRIGLNILFKMLEFKEYLNKIFDIICTLKNEEHYYVNMMVAWLISESFIKNKEETLLFIKGDNLNNFCLNKAISKCCDSYRVTLEEKEMLKKLRKK